MTTYHDLDTQRQQAQLLRWRRWVPFVHWVGIFLAISAGVAAVVIVPMLVGHQGWYWLYTLTLSAPTIGAYLPVPPAPTLYGVVLQSVNIMGYAMLFIVLSHFLMPATQRLVRHTGLPVKPLPKTHPARVFVNELCKHQRIRPPRVCVVHADGIMAYAASAPFRRSVVVISDGLQSQAPVEISQWVLAHEVAHLVYGDTKRSAPWIVAVNALMLLDRCRVTVTNALLAVISHIPLLNRLLIPLVGRPLVLISRALSLVTTLGYRLSTGLYKVFDRWVSRQCEYRADQFAATHAGLAPGIQLMQSLSGPFEPQFTMMATHPMPKQRLMALHLLTPIPEK